MTSPPVGPLAGLTFVLGYAVAAGTGVRVLGGLVLVVGAAGCALLWSRRVGPARTTVIVLVFLLLFVLSHLLARVVGAWPSVLLVAALMCGASWLVADRPGPGAGES